MKKENQGITYDELSKILTNVLDRLAKEDNKHINKTKENK